MLTRPSAPTGTITRFGIVWPARSTFRLEANGRAVAPGNTVTKPGSRASVAVTLTTTADTPEAGTPPRPSTGTPTVAPARAGFPAGHPPVPSRVSSNRAGVSGR